MQSEQIYKDVHIWGEGPELYGGGGGVKYFNVLTAKIVS